MPIHWWGGNPKQKPYTFYDGKTEHIYDDFEKFIIAMQRRHPSAYNFLEELITQYEKRGFISDRQNSVLAEITRGVKNKDWIHA